MNWKFTDSSHKVVFRTLDDGTQESCAFEALQDNPLVDIEDVPAVIVPQAVTKFQAKAALLAFGFLSNVEAIINDPDTDPLVKLAWDNVGEFYRHSPMLNSLGVALELSESELDNLFIEAAKIEV